MTKTWSITQEHTVVTRFVVEGATEDEAVENWHNGSCFACEPEVVDEYDHHMTAIEEDIPDDGTLPMCEMDRGYLYAKGETMRMLLDMDDEPWDDEWKQVLTPCDNWYAINLWRDDITDRVHCTVYQVDFNDGKFTTDCTDWLRLW